MFSGHSGASAARLSPPRITYDNALFVVGRDSERNPLDLIEGNLIGAPVVKSGGPRRFMTGHLLGDLELAAVLQVGGDPGGAEAVGADLGAQSCRSCLLLLQFDVCQSIRLE
jgi:hypothetical protein